MDENTMLWFIDESYFALNSSVSYDWGEKGKKIVLKTNGSKGKDCVIGAVAPYEGNSFFLQWDWIDSSVVSTFLDELSKAYPDKKHLIMLDNASYHRSQGSDDFPLPTNIELMFLPPYSPDFNLIENLWKVLKDEFFNNELFKTLNELKDYVSYVLKLVMNQNEIVLAACGIY
jgi:hypothetical protein